MRKKSIIKLILLFSGIIVALIACEIFLRFFYARPQSIEEVHKLFCEFDSTLGWKKKANFIGTHSTLEYTVTEQSNSKGIRGPEYSYAKKPGEFRILILGDSFAEGYSVDFNNHFSEVLRRKLNKNK